MWRNDRQTVQLINRQIDRTAFKTFPRRIGQGRAVWNIGQRDADSLAGIDIADGDIQRDALVFRAAGADQGNRRQVQIRRDTDGEVLFHHFRCAAIGFRRNRPHRQPDTAREIQRGNQRQTRQGICWDLNRITAIRDAISIFQNEAFIQTGNFYRQAFRPIRIGQGRAEGQGNRLVFNADDRINRQAGCVCHRINRHGQAGRQFRRLIAILRSCGNGQGEIRIRICARRNGQSRQLVWRQDNRTAAEGIACRIGKNGILRQARNCNTDCVPTARGTGIYGQRNAVVFRSRCVQNAEDRLHRNGPKGHPQGFGYAADTVTFCRGCRHAERDRACKPGQGNQGQGRQRGSRNGDRAA